MQGIIHMDDGGTSETSTLLMLQLSWAGASTRKAAAMKGISLLMTVNTLYEAALDPTQWRKALTSATRLLGATGAQLVVSPKDYSVVTSTIVVGFPTEAQKEYAEHYFRVDPRAHLILHRPAETLMQDHLAFDRTFTRRSEFYCDYLRKYDCRYVTGTRFETDDSMVVMAVLSSPRKGPIESPALKRLQRLIPHIRHAVSIQNVLKQRSSFVADTSVLDALLCPAFIVDTAGVVLAMNAAGEAHLQHAQGLRINYGVLCARGSDGRNQLLHLLASQESGAFPRSSSPNRAPPVCIEASPICEGGVRTGRWLIIARIARTLESALDAFGKRHQLSPAECALMAELAKGGSLSILCSKRKIQLPTARSQLRSIFFKTRTSRQSELLVRFSEFRASMS